MSMYDFLTDLSSQLDSRAKIQFGEIEQSILMRAMKACGMAEYPAVTGDPDGERSDFDLLCGTCGRMYGAHPMDWRVIGYGDVPFLNVLCDGRRVKL